MRPPEVILSALWAMRSNRMRTALASLGVLIGVSAVVSLVGLVTGIRNYIRDQFDTVLGARVFEISRYSGGFEDLDSWLESRRWPDLTVDQARELAGLMTTAGGVTWRSGSGGRVTFGDRTVESVRIRALAPSETDVAGFAIGTGRFFTHAEDAARARVCILGSDLAETLGTPAGLIGGDVTVQGYRFTVIGIARPLGSIFGHGLDDFVAVPWSTWSELLSDGRDEVEIAVLPREEVGLEECREEARLVLRRIRGVPFQAPDNFYITTQQGILDSMQKVMAGAAAITIGIAAISLLVGGIGIMNIMLVSVTERTREIGTRRAMGARRRDIVRQFLAEALIISLAGGFLGLLVGYALTIAAERLTPVPAAVSPFAAVLAVSFSAATGLVFGVFPAWKAAGMDPVEALRYE
ncbi:ABC transporter permease [Candidatus Fermentibacteria bacterium]|nr:ABC transporter permease [Candidatus Fermentibacteria bacterium]